MIRFMPCVLLSYVSWLILVPTILADRQGAKIALSDETIDAREHFGTWNVQSINICDGDTGETKDCKGDLRYTLNILSDKKMSLDVEGVKVYEWVVEYDFKKTPVWIDVTPKLPQEHNKKMKGVLKLTGDNLIIHLSNSELRPTTFTQHKGLSSILLKCKRSKRE